MAETRAPALRTLLAVVAVIAAVGLAGIAWPLGVLGVGFGFGLMTQGFFGRPDVGTGLLLLIAGLVLLPAPVVLAALILRRFRSVTGWAVGVGWLVASAVIIYFAATSGFVAGWFRFVD